MQTTLVISTIFFVILAWAKPVECGLSYRTDPMYQVEYPVRILSSPAGDYWLTGPCVEEIRRIEMHENAYGLSRVQRDCLVRMAKSGLYYERYLSNKFDISDEAVRDICAREGNCVCKWLDDKLIHHDGYDIKIEIDRD